MANKTINDLTAASALTGAELVHVEQGGNSRKAFASALIGQEVNNVTALLADTTLTYTAGTGGSVTAGDIVRTRAEGFAYEVAASGATDHHVTTAGGVNLYVRLTADGWFPFEAMAWDKTGTTDALAKLNIAIAYMKSLGLAKIWVGSNGTLNLSADPTDYKFVYLSGSDITLAGGTTTDFAIHDRLDTYTTEAKATGSVGGSGNNQSWKRLFSGSPALTVWERTDVSPNPIVWGAIQANHDGFVISAGPFDATHDKNLILGVKAEQNDEGNYPGLSIGGNNMIFNPGRRNWPVRFYCENNPDAAVMDGITGEFTFKGLNGLMTLQGTGADSIARLYMRNDAQAWSIQTHSSDELRIKNESSGDPVVRFSTGGEIGVGMAPTSTIPLSIAADSYIFRGYDATGATNQITIQANGNVLNVNGSYGTISDRRLKADIQDAGSQWDDIKSVKLRKFRMVSQGENAPLHLGVVAQELEAAGMGGLLEEFGGDDGGTYLAVKQSVLLMKALGALKEAMERIEALEAAL